MKKIKSIVILIFLLSITTFAGNIEGKIEFEGEGLNNVVVYLKSLKKILFPPPKEAAIMDQVDLNFVPHILPVQVGTQIIFPNSDKIRHSVFSMSKIKEFDFGTYSPGNEKSIICKEQGVIPILCYIHHDMSAYVVVLKTPYFSLTNEKGEYLLENIPSGNYTLTFWHENLQIESEEIFVPSQGILTKDISIGE